MRGEGRLRGRLTYRQHFKFNSGRHYLCDGGFSTLLYFFRIFILFMAYLKKVHFEFIKTISEEQTYGK